MKSNLCEKVLEDALCAYNRKCPINGGFENREVFFKDMNELSFFAVRGTPNKLYGFIEKGTLALNRYEQLAYRFKTNERTFYYVPEEDKIILSLTHHLFNRSEW